MHKDTRHSQSSYPLRARARHSAMQHAQSTSALPTAGHASTQRVGGGGGEEEEEEKEEE